MVLNAVFTAPRYRNVLKHGICIIIGQKNETTFTKRLGLATSVVSFKKKQIKPNIHTRRQ